MAQLDVCVVGEINPDLILSGLPHHLQPERETLVEGFRLTLGSSSAIFAHNLAILGSRVGIASKVGVDAMGKMSLEWLAAAGVDVEHVRQAGDSATGVTVILARPTERYILTYPGAISELRYEDLDLDYVFSARHLHISSFFLQKALRPSVAALLREAQKKGLTTSLDTNDDPDDTWASDVRDTLPHVDIFFPNEREAKKIAGIDDLEGAIAYLSRQVGTLVVKLGSNGAVARRGSSEWRCAPLRVNAVDTVGAGDSFDAGFIHRFLQGASVEDCLNFANVTGAFSTTRDGGTEAFRNREELAKFLTACGTR